MRYRLRTLLIVAALLPLVVTFMIGVVDFVVAELRFNAAYWKAVNNLRGPAPGAMPIKDSP